MHLTLPRDERQGVVADDWRTGSLPCEMAILGPDILCGDEEEGYERVWLSILHKLDLIPSPDPALFIL